MESPTDGDWQSGTDTIDSLMSRRLVWGNKTGKIGQIIHAGLLRNWQIGIDAPRVLDNYAIVYNLDGACRFTLPGGTIRRVPAGEMFILFPGVTHQYGPIPQTRWTQFYIAFKGSCFEMWQQRGLLDPGRSFFSLKPVEYWLSRFRSVIRSIPPDDGGDLHAVCAFQLLLAEILASVEPKPSEEQTRWLQRAQAELEAAERADLLDMPAIAERLNMSYVNFRKRFARLARVSPGKFHVALMMQRACRIMMDQKITDQELSQRLGYADPFHFSQRFRQVIGMTPREFRRSMIGRQT